jgi:hypothetical protein
MANPDQIDYYPAGPFYDTVFDAHHLPAECAFGGARRKMVVPSAGPPPDEEGFFMGRKEINNERM